MTIVLESTESVFGEAFIVTATLDRYHRTIVREFFSLTDAQLFCHQLLKQPLEKEYLDLFKRKGL